MKNNSVTSIKNATLEYGIFSSQVVTELDRLIDTGVRDKVATEILLNGAASEALEEHVSRAVRSTDGIFFSGKVLASYVASRIRKKLEGGATVADPACGAGDLLLACAAHFAREVNLTSKMKSWGERLLGIDLHQTFIDAAKARLTLSAASAPGVNLNTGLPKKCLMKIQQGNYFDHIKEIAEVDCVVMNPPFATILAPENCCWASGSVQLAGLFLATALENAKDGQEIVAVLPDVLRSGTRYARWRSFVATSSSIKKIHVHGRFDEQTDVDVFVLHLVKDGSKKNKLTSSWILTDKKQLANKTEASQSFKVSVGAYVPFRAKKSDPLVDYLCVADAIPDGEVFASNKCHFDGTLHSTPFVVIRRTSNPSDPRRVIPTLIEGPAKVAIENHLIVLSPLDGTLASCRKLMKSLKNPEIDKWMNNAIRCRHLTTAIVKKLPLIGWK